jgi:hypothetical protein
LAPIERALYKRIRLRFCFGDDRFRDLAIVAESRLRQATHPLGYMGLWRFRRHNSAPPCWVWIMPNSRTASDVFEQEFLAIRAKLLEVAAALDRVDRADRGEKMVDGDRRRTQVQAAIQVLLRPEDDRAEQIQLIFSRPYEREWQEKFRMTNDE